MSRRIALTILVTVWTTLVAAAATAYLTTRSVMLADLDQSIQNLALSQAEFEVEGGNRFRSMPAAPELVMDALGRTLSRREPSRRPDSTIISASFAKLPGEPRARTLIIRTKAQPIDGGEPREIDIVYRGSAEEFDRLLSRLAIALAITGALGSVVSALLAVIVAKVSLRPLETTARVIGSIDEGQLDRRIVSTELPIELRPVADRLNEMLARLEESVRRRRQFIADASHELRTPVAALIMGMEVALRQPRGAEQYRSTLESCLTDARLLRSLVEALLNQVRAELRPANPVRISVELAEVVNECVVALRPLADARGLRIVTDIPQGLTLHTEPPRLRAILLNLVGNAIEYTGSGGNVTIAARAVEDRLQLRVSDTGPGIAPDQRERVFEPFYRADPSRMDGHLGLGLYLVRSHAQALGGSCVIDAESAQGATFVVELAGVEIPQSGLAVARRARQ